MNDFMNPKIGKQKRKRKKKLICKQSRENM